MENSRICFVDGCPQIPEFICNCLPSLPVLCASHTNSHLRENHSFKHSIEILFTPFSSLEIQKLESIENKIEKLKSEDLNSLLEEYNSKHSELLARIDRLNKEFALKMKSKFKEYSEKVEKAENYLKKQGILGGEEYQNEFLNFLSEFYKIEKPIPFIKPPPEFIDFTETFHNSSENLKIMEKQIEEEGKKERKIEKLRSLNEITEYPVKIIEEEQNSPCIPFKIPLFFTEEQKKNKECMYCRKIVIRPACENYCCCRDCMNIRIREGKSPQRSICHKCSLPLSHKQILTYTELPKQTIVRCDVCKDNIYIRFVWILCIRCKTQICIDCLRYKLRKKNCGRCGCLYTFRQIELNFNYELRYTLVDCCNHYLQDVEILEIDSDRYIIHRACKETFYRIIRTKNF